MRQEEHPRCKNVAIYKAHGARNIGHIKSMLSVTWASSLPADSQSLFNIQGYATPTHDLPTLAPKGFSQLHGEHFSVAQLLSVTNSCASERNDHHLHVLQPCFVCLQEAWS